MIDYRKIIKNREIRLKLINFLRFIPDEPYLKAVFKIKSGKTLDLKDPKTFCDKLNWLKLHDKHPEFTGMADKATARNYVIETLGEDICIPILGTWDSYDDIDFDSLPDRFVLKCNHDSASVKIIKDKSLVDHAALREFYADRLKLNPFVLGREYPYKDIKPCIIAEQFMEDKEKPGLPDYKFLCFNGEPKLMYVASERSTDVKFTFFDMDFNKLDIYSAHENSKVELEKPKNFELMKEYAAKLSAGRRFIRIDLYEINGKVYFGEYTFFYCGGFWPLYPEEWEERLGSWINIDDVKDD